jgi:transcription elongation factor
MTVIEFMEQRNSKTLGKRVRVLESADNTYLGGVVENADRHICRVKITSKIVFIFVD